MPLLLGPMVRYAGRDEATVWVETDAPAEVQVRPDGAPPASARTWTVAGRHYAIVRVRGLPPDAATPYEVRLDGTTVWPEPGSPFPPSVLRTHAEHAPARIVWGSCRVCVPHEPPYSMTKDEDPRGREVDALRTYALRMRGEPPETWPHLLLLLGDQVYADEVSPQTREAIRRRRDPSEPPGEEIADYEEYALLYQESWGEPVMRWLLSTVPSAMIFDDHDVHDDWNTSDAWVRDIRRESWWQDRITGALMSYAVYQHWGNVPPDELDDDPVYRAVSTSPDGTEALREHARHADQETDGVRWSYSRVVGPARVVMIDSRAGRVLVPGRRRMVDEEEWRWIAGQLTGDVRHLVLGTSLPLFLGPGLHHVEAWNEAVCDGVWGGPAAWVGERIRRAVDLEHWAAFRKSFDRLAALIAVVGSGLGGTRPPATITILSGDVHHTYASEVHFPGPMSSRVYQLTCSPFHNSIPLAMRLVFRAAWSSHAQSAARRLARFARVPEVEIDWETAAGPFFGNHLAELRLDGREAFFSLSRSAKTDDGGVRAEPVQDADIDLSGPTHSPGTIPVHAAA